MESFTSLLTKGKALVSDLFARWSGIQSPTVKMAVAIFVAVLVAMVIWAILPWIGFFIAVGLVAVIVRMFWPTSGAGS